MSGISKVIQNIVCNLLGISPASLLEDSAYKKLTKDPTDSIRTQNHTTTEKILT